MTSARVLRHVARAWGVYWRVEERPEISQRMKARAPVDDCQISSIGKWAVDMADRTACVTNGWVAHEEIVAAHGRKSWGFVYMWRRMRLSMVAKLLGFSRERSSSTSMWLVSLGEDLICIDLKEEAWIAWFMDLRHGCEWRWLHNSLRSRSERQQGKWLVWRIDLCARGKFFCCVKIFVWCQEQSLALIPC